MTDNHQEDLDTNNKLQEEAALILEGSKPSEEKLKSLLEDKKENARKGFLEIRKPLSPFLGG